MKKSFAKIKDELLDDDNKEKAQITPITY